MCGTWDHDRTNEYLTPQGTIEPNTNLFGNHWKLQKTCRDEPENFTNPCDNNPKGQEQAKKYCAYLKGDVFKREWSPVFLCSFMHCRQRNIFFKVLSISFAFSLFLHFSISFFHAFFISLPCYFSLSLFVYLISSLPCFRCFSLFLYLLVSLFLIPVIAILIWFSLAFSISFAIFLHSSLHLIIY